MSRDYSATKFLKYMFVMYDGGHDLRARAISSLVSVRPYSCTARGRTAGPSNLNEFGKRQTPQEKVSVMI